MSDMKCPFCQQELVRDTPFAWNCPNEECAETDMMWGTAKLWQELIRTRKALGIAFDALKVYANQENWDFEHFYLQRTYEIAAKALEQITALEQKDK